MRYFHPMHKITQFFCALFFCCTVMGCHYLPYENQELKRDIYEVKVQVGRLQTLQNDTYKLLYSRIQKDDQAREAQFSEMEKNQAELEKRLNKVREELRELRSLVEELRFSLKQGGLNVQEEKGGVSFQGAARNKPGYASDILITEKGETIDGEAILRSAHIYFTSGDYEKARESARKFLDYFSASLRAEKALFLLADSYYYEENYSQAESFFLQLFQKYPAGDHVPDSLVKAAMCQRRLDRKGDARKTLQLVIKEYPQYHDLNRVRAMIKNIGEE